MFSITPITGTLTSSNIATPRLHIEQGDFLRRSHDHAAVERDSLRNSQLRVAGSGRQIDHQAIEVAPFDVEQELASSFVDHRAAPDDRARIVEEKRHRDVADAEALQRDDPAILGHRDLPRASAVPTIIAILGP